MSIEEENYLWYHAIIVLDTSTLGNLYRMAEEPKQTLLEIFDIVKKRIWLPGHVVYEYKKNREELIESSFSSYYLPKQGVFVNRYEAEMNEFLKDNISDNYHPYLEENPDAFVSVSSASAVYGRGFDEMKTGLERKKKQK